MLWEPCTFIESDNCKVQYKSSTHFWSIQELANNYAVPIICVFSIAEHDKAEIDHVGEVSPRQPYEGQSKEIDNKELFLPRTEVKLKVHIPCYGFLSILQHKSISQLCICSKCQVEYGSCELFIQYILEIQQLKKMNLRSAQTEEFLEEGVGKGHLHYKTIFCYKVAFDL